MNKQEELEKRKMELENQQCRCRKDYRCCKCLDLSIINRRFDDVKEGIEIGRQKKKHNPNCKVCGRELTVYFSEDFIGSNEGTCGFKCDWCDSKEQERQRILKIINEQIENCIENDCAAVICIKELKEKIENHSFGDTRVPKRLDGQVRKTKRETYTGEKSPVHTRKRKDKQK